MIPAVKTACARALELSKAATGGPWHADITRPGAQGAVCRSEAIRAAEYPHAHICEHPQDRVLPAKAIRANLDFIAFSRDFTERAAEWMPKLIASLERIASFEMPEHMLGWEQQDARRALAAIEAAFASGEREGV